MGQALDIFHHEMAESKQYSTTTAKQLCFREAALLAQETTAAEDKGKSQAMLFAMLQEQHDKQIVAMTATNKANMDAMMERMNALVTGGAGGCQTQQDKASTPTVRNSLPTLTGSGTTQPKKPKMRKCIFPHCKMFILHKPKNCVKLTANKDKHWPGWKLVHTIAQQTPGTNKVDLDIVAVKIKHNAQLHTSNY
jgi:hypothetical protein